MGAILISNGPLFDSWIGAELFGASSPNACEKGWGFIR
jgi:hypothetical protein